MPSYITLDSDTRTFTVDTSQILTTVTITFTITGVLPYPGPSLTKNFNVNFESCYSATVTSIPIPTQSIYVYSTTPTYTIPGWIESFGVCGPYIYTATTTLDTALPNILSFNGTTGVFSVDTE